jgi:hypothetical protein
MPIAQVLETCPLQISDALRLGPLKKKEEKKTRVPSTCLGGKADQSIAPVLQVLQVLQV